MAKTDIKAKIRDLMLGRQKGRPCLIYFSEKYTIVNYKDKPSEYLKKAEAKKLIAKYPGVPVYEICFLDESDIKL